MPILEVKNLTHTYSPGTPFEKTAVENVSFSAEAGEFIGIIGHTGSGKSTLIQHMNGLLKPTAGEVLFHGASIWKEKKALRTLRGRIGLVFQYPEYQLFEETVRKDIAFGPSNQGLRGDELEARVETAAGFVGLDPELLEKSPFDLSGGQKRRVAIAGVIAMEPEVLILDEPTAGLDAAGRREILDNILTYQRARNATVFMVTHSMEEVARLADQLIVMDHGRVDAIGTPEEIFSRAEHLSEIGLDIPQVTRVILSLRQLGTELPGTVYTVEQAVSALRQWKRGEPG